MGRLIKTLGIGEMGDTALCGNLLAPSGAPHVTVVEPNTGKGASCHSVTTVTLNLHYIINATQGN